MKRENKQQQGEATEPRDDEIALTAYQLWENDGRPDGHDIEHWLQAKSKLAVENGRAMKVETARSH